MSHLGNVSILTDKHLDTNVFEEGNTVPWHGVSATSFIPPNPVRPP